MINMLLNHLEISTKITDEFKKISPDAVVIFGDRYEMLAATISAYILKINIILLLWEKNFRFFR